MAVLMRAVIHLLPRCPVGWSPRFRGTRIGGATWDREAAAPTKLFTWGKVRPLAVDMGRRSDRAADARRRNVRWLTPRAWRWWMDLGLRGLRSDGSPRPGRDGRTELRNTAFVQLQLSSGLCRQEGGGLLTLELPTQKLGRGLYSHGTAPWALTRSKKTREGLPDVAAERTDHLGVDSGER
ncbi:hypothetical protein [Streptomyces griseoloalbus]|uniref:Uncharacterized protein n=1 Tax=Streptomyces griseoloalbus TaxID=67303 RepID=A0A7W8BTA1_9ACTN|nr:hypothetical protein [Streptomyces albaduncus]MBB5129234.1 hypothetical protein [Streptomyces albaduncus]